MESFFFLIHAKFSQYLSRRERAVTVAAPGFTLIEMLVVLAIIGIITIIAVVGQSNFNRSLLLTETAYTIALSIRESQSFGLSSKLFSGVQNAGYGIHFSNTGGSATSYIQFADITTSAPLPTPASCNTGTVGYPDAKPGNCMYDGASERVQQYTLGQGYTISNLCGLQTNGTQICSGSYPGSSFALDVVFARPNTGVSITSVLNGVEIPLTQAIVHVASPQSIERCVLVTQLGQVSVVTTCP